MKNLQLIKELLEDIKAKDIKIYDNEDKSPFFKYIVLATTNDRQANAFIAKMKSHNIVNTERVEGRNSGWTLVDLGETIVHLFSDDSRKYYDFDTKLISSKLLEI